MSQVEDTRVTRPIKRVLSLDGGAQRGMAEVWFLEEMRRESGVRHWSDHFSLIVGISFGAMVGACLALDDNQPLTDYFTHASSQAIMDKGLMDRLLGEFQPRPKYDGVAKTARLREKFADLTLGDLKIPFVTCTWNLNAAGVKIWKSWEDTGVSLVAVLDAATAAPIFFPAVRVPLSAGEPGDFHVDGGVAANNPVIVSKFCADDLFPDAEIRILSVGTGSSHVTPIQDDDNPNHWGVVQYLRHGLIDIVMNSTNQLTSMLTRYGIADMFVRCDPDLSDVAFDDTTLESWDHIRDAGIQLWGAHSQAVLRLLEGASTCFETETVPATAGATAAEKGTQSRSPRHLSPRRPGRPPAPLQNGSTSV